MNSVPPKNKRLTRLLSLQQIPTRASLIRDMIKQEVEFHLLHLSTKIEESMTCSWAYGVTDGGFNEIVMRCHHLRRLSLIGCYQIYGEILNDVPKKYFKYIEYLNFEQCNQIEDEILIELYRRKKSISIVDEEEE